MATESEEPPKPRADDIGTWEQAGRFCDEAARSFGGRLLMDGGTYVLLPPGAAGTVIVVRQDGNGAVLSVGPYASVTFDWSEASALDDLRSVIDAVQQGDAETHFGRQGRLLVNAGSRFGLHGGLGGAPGAAPTLVLHLPAWR